MIPIVPTLHAGSRDIIQDPSDVIAYLISFMFTNPGEISSQFEDLLMSFRKSEAVWETDRESLTNTIRSELQQVINRYYPSGNYSVSLVDSTVDDTTYKLILSITDAKGEMVINNPNIAISGNSVSLVFES